MGTTANSGKMLAMTNEANSNRSPVSDLEMYLMYPSSDTIKIGQEFQSPWREELNGRQRYEVKVIWSHGIGLDYNGISSHPWGTNMPRDGYDVFHTFDCKVYFIAVKIGVARG